PGLPRPAFAVQTRDEEPQGEQPLAEDARDQDIGKGVVHEPGMSEIDVGEPGYGHQQPEEPRQEFRSVDEVADEQTMNAEWHEGKTVDRVEELRGVRAPKQVEHAEVVQRIEGHDRDENEP